MDPYQRGFYLLTDSLSIIWSNCGLSYNSWQPHHAQMVPITARLNSAISARYLLFIPSSDLRRIDTLLKGSNSVIIVLPSFWKGIETRRKEFVFLLELIAFRKGLCVQKKHTGSHKIICLVKIAESLPSLPKPLKDVFNLFIKSGFFYLNP